MQARIQARLRRARLPLAATVAAGLLAAGCGEPVNAESHSGFQSDQSKIEIVSAFVGGKNVFIPATVVIASGKPHTLSIYNTTETIHGFAIAGIGVEEQLAPQTEHSVALPALEGGRIYRIHCHLHGAHRSGTLVVMP